MIKKIIHLADIHIRTYKRHDEYREQLTKFINEITEFAKDYSRDELRIVVAGDIVHQKITISNEQQVLVGWFLNELSKVALTYILPGNHDLLEDNHDRLDSLTPILKLMNNDNIIYWKKSECMVDDNIVWCPFCIMEHNKRPNIEEFKELYSDKTYVSVYHGVIQGAKTSLGFEFASFAVTTSYFEGSDFVIMGDQHLRQSFKMENGNPLVFSSSILSQDYGESVSNHGYLIWDVSTKTYIEKDLESDYGFYQFKITKSDDILNDKEELINK